MRRRRTPLLAELHAHTTWSDGTMTVRQLVDIVGVRGFDILSVTDHVVRTHDPWLQAAHAVAIGLRARRPVYLARVEDDRERLAA